VTRTPSVSSPVCKTIDIKLMIANIRSILFICYGGQTPARRKSATSNSSRTRVDKGNIQRLKDVRKIYKHAQAVHENPPTTE